MAAATAPRRYSGRYRRPTAPDTSRYLRRGGSCSPIVASLTFSMRHGSLFSGIGGFDLAARWMGWDNIFHVERDPFCRQVLAHHFPNSDSYDDIKQFRATAYAGRVDIISGGFPCQPFSAAGKRAGTSDDRYLWPEMFRVVREARPTWVVAENVRGLISWNEGLVLDTVCADLEGEGYEVFPVVLPAASVNAPHRRDRIWIVAHSNDIRSNQPKKSTKQQRGTEIRTTSSKHCGTHANYEDATNAEHDGSHRTGRDASESSGDESKDGILVGNGADATNANCKQLEGRNGQGTSCRSADSPQRTEPSDGPRKWKTFPTVAPVCGGDDGLPERLDSITFPKWRRESIKAYGNAIVPQVAYQIFKALQGER